MYGCYSYTGYQLVEDNITSEEEAIQKCIEKLIEEYNERMEKADGTDYCVSVESIKDSKDFIQKLDNLINQVRQNEQ